LSLTENSFITPLDLSEYLINLVHALHAGKNYYTQKEYNDLEKPLKSPVLRRRLAVKNVDPVFLKMK
tara:strand:+ start:49430 stop:49630 length:201 start_codon:yes stop_codon:yes gene_type:complete